MSRNETARFSGLNGYESRRVSRTEKKKEEECRESGHATGNYLRPVPHDAAEVAHSAAGEIGTNSGCITGWATTGVDSRTKLRQYREIIEDIREIKFDMVEGQ